MRFRYRLRNETYELRLERAEGGYRAKVRGEAYLVEVVGMQDGEIMLLVNGRQMQVHWVEENGKRWMSIDGRAYVLEKVSTSRRGGKGSADSGNLVRAPMPGQVREVLTAEGDKVARGQTLMLLEAMKMEMRILAPRDGKVVKLSVKQGQQVDKDDALVEVE